MPRSSFTGLCRVLRQSVMSIARNTARASRSHVHDTFVANSQSRPIRAGSAGRSRGSAVTPPSPIDRDWSLDRAGSADFASSADVAWSADFAWSAACACFRVFDFPVVLVFLIFTSPHVRRHPKSVGPSRMGGPSLVGGLSRIVEFVEDSGLRTRRTGRSADRVSTELTWRGRIVQAATQTSRPDPRRCPVWATPVCRSRLAPPSVVVRWMKSSQSALDVL